MMISQIAGVLPAVVFPAATALQLVRMVRARSAIGVSVTTWTLFGFANIAMYVYAERYFEWQSIFGMLLTSVLDFAIAALAWRARRQLARLVRTSAIPPAERLSAEEVSARS